MSKIMDRIYTISDYYDGPIQGIASVNSEPHIYQCIFDEKAEEYSRTYSLQPISNECFELFIEQWDIWLRWEAAFKSGSALISSHPVLAEDKNRNDELNQLINALLDKNSTDLKILKAEFILPEKPGWASTWQVIWHEATA
jgi:hypothetical protein